MILIFPIENLTTIAEKVAQMECLNDRNSCFRKICDSEEWNIIIVNIV